MVLLLEGVLEEQLQQNAFKEGLEPTLGRAMWLEPALGQALGLEPTLEGNLEGAYEEQVTEVAQTPSQR